MEPEALERRWLQAIQERIKEIFNILCMPVRPLHLIRAIAPMRCSLERPEAKEVQQEPKWKTRGCEAAQAAHRGSPMEPEALERRWLQAIPERVKEIFDILCMPVRPLHLVNALALMRCSLERLLELEDTEQCLEQEDSGLDLAIRELEDVEVRLEPEDSGLEPEGSGRQVFGAPPH